MTDTGEPRHSTSFARMLRFWRQAFGLSQEALAESIETTPRHISRLENSRVFPSRELILRIVEQLELGERDRSQLLFSAGFAPDQPIRDFNEPALAWLRRLVAVNLAMLEPAPAMLLGHGNRVHMVNRPWLGMLGNAAEPGEVLTVFGYFDWLFTLQRKYLSDEKREQLLSGVLMTWQQEALLWDDPEQTDLAEALARRHHLPPDWRRRAARIEPMVSFSAVIEVDGKPAKCLHTSHAVNPLGPSTTHAEPRLMMTTLLPMDPGLDLSPLQQHTLDHPSLCQHHLTAAQS